MAITQYANMPVIESSITEKGNKDREEIFLTVGIGDIFTLIRENKNPEAEIINSNSMKPPYVTKIVITVPIIELMLSASDSPDFICLIDETELIRTITDNKTQEMIKHKSITDDAFLVMLCIPPFVK